MVYVLYDNYGELKKSIFSLRNFICKTNFKLDIFIIDNSSFLCEDQKIQDLRNFISEVGEENFSCNYYASEKNMGFGKGCNFGAGLGNAEIILFVNCDTDFRFYKLSFWKTFRSHI